MSDKLRAEKVDVNALTANKITVSAIEAGHVSIVTWNGKTGKDAKFGVKHLYSDKYRERWPKDEYPELYEEDVSVD